MKYETITVSLSISNKTAINGGFVVFNSTHNYSI